MKGKQAIYIKIVFIYTKIKKYTYRRYGTFGSINTFWFFVVLRAYRSSMLHSNHEVQTLVHSCLYTNISSNRSYLHIRDQKQVAAILLTGQTLHFRVDPVARRDRVGRFSRGGMKTKDPVSVDNY